MARTTAEIKKTMTDAFMADATIREKYGLQDGNTWGEKFSAVSLENILFFIVAACCRTLEVMFERFAEDTEARMETAVVASVPWYHKTAMAFQYGDSLTLDEETMRYGYAEEDEGKRVVKYAAVRDMGSSVQILVSGEEDGRPVALSNGVLAAFKQYMNKVKIAGVTLSVRSRNPDKLLIRAKVYIDPLAVNADGSSISGGGRPVEEAVTAYLNGITYGGTFNKTRLTEAITAADGVTDVELGDCFAKADGEAEYAEIKGNNYTAVGGCFAAEGLANTISYEIQS